jgi:hypothetical protein
MHAAGISIGDGIDFLTECNMVSAKPLLPFFKDALVGTKLAFDTFGCHNIIQGFPAVFTGPGRGGRHICIHIGEFIGKAAEWADAGCGNAESGNPQAEELPLAEPLTTFGFHPIKIQNSCAL